MNDCCFFLCSRELGLLHDHVAEKLACLFEVNLKNGIASLSLYSFATCLPPNQPNLDQALQNLLAGPLAEIPGFILDQEEQRLGESLRLATPLV